MKSQQRKRQVARLSVLSNSLLVVFKLAVGLMIGAVSVISEAIHSAVDLVAALIALFAVKASGKPADEKHTFGHGKFENLSAAIEGFLIFVAAVWIIVEAVKKLMYPAPVEAVQWGVIVMAVSATANFIISNRLFKVGRATDSAALMADGWHLRTDVWTSAGVSLGLLLYILGRYFFPELNLHWVDPVIALGVAALILKAAWELTSESIMALLDSSLPHEEEKLIRSIIESMNPIVLSFHKLKTRKAGADRFIEFHLVVNKDMSVKAAHDVCDDITLRIKKELPNAVVMIHTEPCLDNCGGICRGTCEIFDE
ncbi:MAG TPA: cation diffusion facilitator family transporter [Bacteroidales bacterium]|nr:cation diffusion facilitator family transporter [Bacteroidales bacterium]HPT01694.1 cation diffusion facilitator family transporter [Bacteroidales bacterium]